MSELFENFIIRNEKKIHSIADRLQNFEINAKKIGIENAKSRVIEWLRNFDKLGYKKFKYALGLIEKIEFIKLDYICAALVNDSEKLVRQENSYITYLGERKESSFKITSKFHANPNYCLSLTELLEKLPNTKGNKILLFDDFLNSGGQLVSIFYRLLGKQLPNGEINDESESRTKLNTDQIRKLKNVEIFLFYYIVFDEGIKKVEQRIKKELSLNINVENHFHANENDGAFGDTNEQEKIRGKATGKMKHRSIFQGHNYSDLTELYGILKVVGELLLRSNEPKWEERKFKDRALGYGNLSRVIITDSNVPTVTLTALWQKGTIQIGEKKIFWNELVPRTKKVFDKEKNNLSLEVMDVEVNTLAEELQTLYDMDEFREGLRKSEHYFERYGAHPKILKYVLRFNLRDINFSRIAKIINDLDQSELSDEQKAICGFTLFESSLGEAIELRSDREKFNKSLIDLRKHLNNIPTSQKSSSQFYYFEGRWNLEMWYANPENLIHLTRALSSFNQAISIKNNWWTQCYKCIVLNLLESKQFETEAKSFKERIFKVDEEKDPIRHIVKIYRANALIFLNDLSELKNCLSKNEETYPSYFENSLVHRIEMFFYYDKKKQDKYRKIIEKWIKAMPRK